MLSNPPKFLSQHLHHGAVICSYAVRGSVVQKAMELERQGRKIYYCNIGNPQSLGQPPLTFLRQILSLVSYPQLLTTPQVEKIFPRDVCARAQRYLSVLPGGSSGSYTHSAGIHEIREDVAKYLIQRDGKNVQSDPDTIFLTDGASTAASMLLRLLIRDGNDGILVPTPRYPLYSALLDLMGGARVDYYLDEASGWQLSLSELQRAYDEAKSRGVQSRALVVVNPGNPSGNIMTRDSLRDTVSFCAKNNLVLIADEVYQENIWTPGGKFISFKRVANEMGADIQLASLHSVSKGYFGECGRRGGFLELSGFSQDVRDLIYKMASVHLCSNVDGQIAVGVMCLPPQRGEESYDLYCKERDAILSSLKRRAMAVGKLLNSGSTLTCALPEGALYAFPQMHLPPAFVRKFSKNPDEAYCLQLLEATGIVVVPGSGFGQREGSHHFRVTILPPEDELQQVLGRIVEFHDALWKKFS